MKRTEGQKFFERNGEMLQQGARQVRKKYDWILELDDVDDIEMQATHKIFKTYFHPDSSQEYEFRSEGQDRQFVKKILESVAIDLTRKRRREKEIFNLMTDLENLGESSPVSQSHINQRFGVENAAISKIELEDTLRRICDTPRKQAVMSFLLGESTREEININDVNFNTIKHRLLKQLYPER